MTVVTIIQSLMMSGLILFFVVLMENFSFYSLIYGLFLLYLFVAMSVKEQKKKGSGVIYRRIYQSMYAVLFSITFISDLIAERGSMSITTEAFANAELPFCHIAIPQVLTPFVVAKNIIFPARVTGHYASIASMLCIWFICTVTLGRGWCSWVCFYGGWEEGFSHLSKKRRIRLLSKNREIREFQFGFFAFIVLASLGSMAAIYCEWFCPFKLVTEYAPMNSLSSIVAGIIFIGLFVSLVVVLPFLTKKRTQCSTLCPFGAFASLTDRFSSFKINIDTEKCKHCMKCAVTCPFGAIDVYTIKENKGSPELTCAKCGECIGVCSEKAISYGFRFGKKCSKPQPKNRAEKILQAFLDPAVLFRFSAFTFFVIMSGNFATRALSIIVNFISGVVL